MQLKFKIRSTKHETNSKSECSNDQNKDIGKYLIIFCLGHLDFGHLDLFGISILSFGLPTLRVGPRFRYSDLIDVLSFRELWPT